MTEARGLTGILGGGLFLIIAYAAGRWQFNRAGAIVDEHFERYPRAIAGVATLSAGLFAHEILEKKKSIAPTVITAVGLFLILEEVFIQGRQRRAELSPGEPVLMV